MEQGKEGETMAQGPFSENFIEFFKKITTDVNNPETFLTRISAYCHLVKGELMLGKSRVIIDTLPSVYEPQGFHKDIVVYESSHGFEPEGKSYRFITEEKGIVIIENYPAKGHTWTQGELDQLYVYSYMVKVIYGRIRLGKLMKKAPVTDAATGLLNTVGIMKAASKLSAVGTISKYCLAFINIKNFKHINKKLGMRVGDVILQEYGIQIKKFCKADEMIARLGGDNFLAYIKKENFGEFIEKILNVKVGIQIKGVVKTFNVCSRVGYIPISEVDTLDNLMTKASILISEAKKINVDVIKYNDALYDRISKSNTISSAFPYAIEQHDFLVYYQPKVDSKSKLLIGAEALVRWKRDNEIYAPGDFIEVLETDGTIRELDFYVLENVCSAMERWSREGISLIPVSINFSREHFFDRELADRIMSFITKHEIDPKYIQIELTELSEERDREGLKEFLSSLKEKGVSVAIDDFGTGYSTLKFLNEYDVDEIKLDKSFIDSIPEGDSKGKTIVKNTINMIKEIGMKVIAEGVETEFQEKELSQIGLTHIQGYLYDKPLPEDIFVERLRAGSYL